jgi:Ca2+:H+ antiporter
LISTSTIALGSASQIALFVAPVLVLLSYVIGPTPMDLRFWPGAVVMVFIATVVAAFIISGGGSAWFVGVLLMLVYAVFAITLCLIPPACSDDCATASRVRAILYHRVTSDVGHLHSASA